MAAARPAGPAPTMSAPTSIRSSGGSEGSATNSSGSKGGGKSAGRTLIGPTSALPRLHELGELRDYLMHVADDAQVGVFEDGRVRVLVDGDDRPGALHPHLVLDRAGDSAGDVELRRDRLACLADLARVRIPPGVDDGARGRHRTAEGLGEILDEGEVLRLPEPAPA